MCSRSLFPRYLTEFVCADGTSAGGERSRVGSSGASGDGKAGSGEGKQKAARPDGRPGGAAGTQTQAGRQRPGHRPQDHPM